MVTRFDSLNTWLSTLTLKIGHHRRSRKNTGPNGLPRSSTMAPGNEESSSVCRSTTFPSLGKNLLQKNNASLTKFIKSIIFLLSLSLVHLHIIAPCCMVGVNKNDA